MTEHHATFAGGCFWCMESPFAGLPGVLGLTVGYTGGTTENPTYAEVCAGDTGHAEAIELRYDPALISYGQLLEVFWRTIDPTDGGGQFVDRGSQYRSAIFYHDEAQKTAATASIQALEESGTLPGPVKTSLEQAGTFYAAEDYHQQFCRKQPLRYQTYRSGSGRPARLSVLWGLKGE